MAVETVDNWQVEAGAARPVYIVNEGVPTTGGSSGGGDASAANQQTQITAEQAIQATLGATNGAAVTTDANGTIQQFARGIVTILGAVTASPVANSIGDRLKALLTGIVLAAGTNLIGKVGIDQTTVETNRVTVGGTVLLSSTPTLSVAGAYATGDYIGPSTTPASFTNVSRASGLGDIVKSLVMVDNVTTAAVALELWLFSATFTAPTDNAAWSISDGDAANCIGVIPIGTGKWYASALNKIFSDDTLGLVIAPAVTTIFYALVARGTTPTWASGDLSLKLGVLQQ